jgi:E3 ubiquitin-protein ligase HECTD4
VRQLRLREWEARERMVALRAGLATTAPLGVILHLFSPEDLELRVCGLPHVDLKFLRAHTIYQVSYSLKKESGFPIPSRDVTYLTLPGRE